MNQEKPEEYIAQWKARLVREKAQRLDGKTSVVLFRTGRNWFALATGVFREVVEPRVIRRIPHRTNSILLGLVNVRGGLHLCVNFPNLIQSSASEKESFLVQERTTQSRMAVIEKEGNTWAFHVDEIHSLFRISAKDVVPFSDQEKCSRGIIEWQGKTVDVLDENLLFQKLARSLE